MATFRNGELVFPVHFIIKPKLFKGKPCMKATATVLEVNHLALLLFRLVSEVFP